MKEEQDYVYKPKIAVIIPKYGLVGGAERFAYEVTERLANSGKYELHVFANQWEAAENSTVIFHKVPEIKYSRILRALAFPFFIKYMLNKHYFDLVYSHERVFYADVISLHGTPHEYWVREIRRKSKSVFDHIVIGVERRMIASGRTSYFLPVSSLCHESYIKTYEHLPGNWRVMHPAVDLDKFLTPKHSQHYANIREKYNIGISDVVILFVGMNFEIKGLGTIIKAVSEASRLREDITIRLLVVGRGNKTRYMKLAKELGIEHLVTFVGISKDDISYYYAAADFLMLLSVFDTFGMVVLESMATATPVIVSSTVGAKDIVKDGVNGFIVMDSNNYIEASERILNLLDDGIRHNMKLNAARTATNYDWEILVDNLESIFHDVLTKKGLCL